MDKKLRELIDKLLENRIRRMVALVLAIVVTFTTTYTLVLPAITLEKDTADTMSGVNMGGNEQDGDTSASNDGDGSDDNGLDDSNAETVAFDAEAKNEDGETETLVHVETGVDTFPEGTSMEATVVTDQDVIDNITEAAEGEVVAVRAVDLTFTDENSETVQASEGSQLNVTLSAGEGVSSSAQNEEDASDSTEQLDGSNGEEASAGRNTETTVIQYTEDRGAEPVETNDDVTFQVEPENDLDQDNAVSFDMAEQTGDQASQTFAIVETVPENSVKDNDLTDIENEAKEVEAGTSGDVSATENEIEAETEENPDADATAGAPAEEQEVPEEEPVEEYAENVLTAQDDAYIVTMTYGPEADIPQDAYLRVEEIVEAETYDTHLEETQKALNEAVQTEQPAEEGIYAGPAAEEPQFFGARSLMSDPDAFDRQKTATETAPAAPEPEIVYARFFDITILDAGGNEVTPAAPVKVAIELLDADQEEEAIQNADSARVVHFGEEKTEVMQAEALEDTVAGVSFDAEGFSVYGVVYTVDFEYTVNGETYEFSLPGGGFITLKNLVEVLGIISDNEQSIDQFVADIKNVEFSDPSLVWVGKVDTDMTLGMVKSAYGLEVEYSSELTEEDISRLNDSQIAAGEWVLISLNAFDTEESLTVTMKDGEVWTVKVTDAQITKDFIDAKGDTWTITVIFDESAGIPEDAELKVREILPEDEEYDSYYQQSLAKVGAIETVGSETEVEEESEEASDDESTPTSASGYAHIFDIQIWAEDHEIQPVSDVFVSIKLTDAPEDENTNLHIVHFGKDGLEVMALTVGGEEDDTKVATGTELIFMTDEFSVYSVVDVTSSTDIVSTGPFALVTGIAGDSGATTGYGENWGTDYFTIIVNANAMMGYDGIVAIPETDENTSWVEKTKGLGAEGVHAWTDSNGNNYVGGGATQWQFESAGNGKYRIFTNDNGSKQYITHNNAEVSLTNDQWSATAFSITPNNDGTVLIHDNNMYLRNNDGNANGTSGWTEWVGRNYILKDNSSAPTGNEYKFRLCKESDEFEPESAQKVSAASITTNANYVIYRKFEDAQGNESLYALAHDGTFVRVYDGGDTIYWRETDKNIYWNYETNESGYPVLLTRNPATNEAIYLNPNHATGQTMAESTTGITLLGKDNGEYGTAIECWDQTSYDYAGLHVMVDDNGTATLSTGTRVAGTSDEFLFAVASTYPGAEAEPVATVDSDSLGIKITMFDYGDANNPYYAGYKLPEMTAIAGSDEYTPHAAHALVKAYLESGVPSSLINGAMTGLFSSGGAITYSQSNVNHLFLQSYYDENGTFRYRSEDNYAYLGLDGSTDFIVYRQAATPYTSDNTPGHSYYHHGHFMPFNEIDMNNNLSRLMNQYGNEYTNGTAVGEIPLEDGRTYEDIYGVQGIPNFYTGMKMEANFSQPKNGKLENGDDMVFKFTGDDDMWVYIDGILVLDIGGIHEPLSGTINFATGVVTNPTGSSLTGTKTLYQIFQDVLTASGTPQEVKDKINSITWKDVNGDGTPDTFADYTNHSFSAFYMERGAGASNLDIQFNLKVTLTNEFTVEKKIPEGVDERFANQTYKFQATYMDGSTEKPLHAGIANVCTAVVYKGTNDPVPVDENGYFYLKAGEAAVFKMADESIRYNVKEVGIDSSLIEQVDVNGQQKTVTDGTVEAGNAYVGDRSQVLYMNHPYTQNLLITKHITEDSAPLEPGENPVFEFRVYLESTVENENGTTERKLVPYSYAPYYLVKEVGGVKHYYTLTGTNNAPEDKGTEPVVCSTTGRSGSINSIPPEYTIVIPNLVVGTNFYVEERLDNIPTGYSFVREELTDGTYDPNDLGTTDEIIDHILPRDQEGDQDFDPSTIGRIKKGVDAESHVYNRKLKQETDITVEKQWAGNMPAGSSTMVLYKVVGENGAPSSKISVTIQTSPAPVTTSAGNITVYYTGTKADGTEDSGSFVLSNATGWSKAFNYDRGGVYSFSYTPDGTKVLTAVPDKTGAFSESTTVTLSTTAAEIAKYIYTFSVPENLRSDKGSIAVTCNGSTQTASNANSWTVSFEVAEEETVAFSAQPDGKFIESVALNPVAATPASQDVAVTMTPSYAATTMTVPVSVNWDQSATSLPDDAQVTFTFTGNGRTQTVTLPVGNSWSSSVSLDRLDADGNLIVYSVEATATTQSNKKLTLGNIPASISGGGSIEANGVVKSAEPVKVWVELYTQNFTQKYYTSATKEYEPGKTILVKVNRMDNNGLVVSYNTSDGKSGTIDYNSSPTWGMVEKSIELKLPDSPGDYTVKISQNWDSSNVTFVSIEEVYDVTSNPASSTRMMSMARGFRSTNAVTISPTQTFYDSSVGGTGDLPFTLIQFKDLPYGAEVVETVTLTGNGSKKWENLPTLDENGNRIYYYIVEKDATAQADTMTVTYQYTYRDDGSIEKVTIINTTHGTEKPDTKDFSFTKIWRVAVGETRIPWPSEKSITVTIKQDSNDYATYTISSAQLAEGTSIPANEDGKEPLVVTAADSETGYVFTLTGLPYGDTDAGYTYYVTEAHDQNDSEYQSPKYFNSDGSQAMGAQQIGNGGTIANDEIGYVLPSTGGPGTEIFKLLGSMLVMLAGAGFILLQRKKRVE